MLNTATVTATLVPAGNEEIIRSAVTSREPDEHVATEDIAWWLSLPGAPGDPRRPGRPRLAVAMAAKTIIGSAPSHADSAHADLAGVRDAFADEHSDVSETPAVERRA